MQAATYTAIVLSLFAARPPYHADGGGTPSLPVQSCCSSLRIAAQIIAVRVYSCPAKADIRVRRSDVTRRVGDGAYAPPGEAEAGCGHDSAKSPSGDTSIRRFSWSRRRRYKLDCSIVQSLTRLEAASPWFCRHSLTFFHYPWSVAGFACAPLLGHPLRGRPVGRGI